MAGWLEFNGGVKLGKGILYFDMWESLSIKIFDSNTEKWSPLNDSLNESLKDLCEFEFINNTIFLRGFGKQTGQWMEWEIINPDMYAEF